MDKKIIVAIDGFSSCGKSTMAKSLALRHQYTYIDTGAMYRAVALYALRNGFFKADTLDKDALIKNLPDIHISFCNQRICLNGEDVESEIRGLTVSNVVSIVATVPEVRSEMVRLQREIGGSKGVVLDGRDIGTVVFPDAELKIFLTADVRVRAQRRYDELMAKGQPASFEEILHNVEMRDQMDLTRETSPLRKADDAIVLDNSYLTMQQQDEWVEKHFNDATH